MLHEEVSKYRAEHHVFAHVSMPGALNALAGKLSALLSSLHSLLLWSLVNTPNTQAMITLLPLPLD